MISISIQKKDSLDASVGGKGELDALVGDKGSVDVYADNKATLSAYIDKQEASAYAAKNVTMSTSVDKKGYLGAFVVGKGSLTFSVGKYIVTIRSCFGSGMWTGEKPWIGTDAWKSK